MKRVILWLWQSIFDRGAPYYVLPDVRPFNLPPSCPPPHYDLVTWLKESGAVPQDAEIYAGPVRYSKRLADAYIFTTQSVGSRPWWSYAASKLGVPSIVIFNSHNLQAQFFPPAVPVIFDGIVWDAAYVMTQPCIGILRNAGARIAKYIVDPGITTVDSGARIELPRKLLVAVCDIDPNPNKPLNYATEEVVLSFLDQVSRAIVSVGAIPVWKPKGALKPEHSLVPGDVRANADRYLAIAERHGAIICPSGTPIGWLAEQVDCAVCLPFTSAATTFAHAGRAVVYFDVTGRVVDQITAARNVPVITDQIALGQWLTGIHHPRQRAVSAM